MTSAPDVWTVALWDHFLTAIQSGQPCYLAADKKLILELFAERFGGGSLAEAERSFHDACLSLLNKSGTGVALKPQAIQRVPHKPYSRVICLAVQQVLVVELMLNDGDYSQDAYFPRYRKCLGVPAGHSNPFWGEDFVRIWDALEKEMELPL